MTCGKCNCDSAECICDKMCGHDGGLYVPPKKKMEEHYPCDDPHYNDWPYGLAGWMPEYVKQVKLDQAIRRFPKRDLRLLVGERDMCNENLPGCNDLCWTKHNETGLGFCYRNHMDTRCPAMMQGQFRRIRGLRYTEYMMRFYMKTTHPLFIVPGVGHDANGMFASEKGIQTIFEHTKGCFESDSKEEEEEAGAEEGPAKARALAAAQTSGGWAPGVAIAAAAFAAGVIATITLKGGKRDDELPSAASYGATDDGVRM